MTTTEIKVSFPDENPRVAGQLAADFENSMKKALHDQGDNASVALEKSNPDALDVGTIIGIIFASQATIALAKGIADWMRRKNQASVTIAAPDGRIIKIRNAESEHIADALKNTQQSG